MPAYISASRTYFEEQTGRPTITQTREYALDAVPYQTAIEIPHPPLLSVSSVTYLDASGVEQTFSADNYRVHPSVIDERVPVTVSDMAAAIGATPIGSYPALDEDTTEEFAAIDPYCPCGRIELVAGASWPVASGDRCLRIRYVCGYGETVEEIPDMVKVTIALLVGHFHTNRQEVSEWQMHKLPTGAEAMIEPFKYRAYVTRPPRAFLDV